MVAPNGARRSKADHPALPVTLPAIVATARACEAAEAGAIHAHLRDAEGRHVLDAGRARKLVAEMARAVPAMPAQISTKAAGRSCPEAQRAFLTELLRGAPAEGVSIALSELLADGERAAARRSYHARAEAGVPVQHILYDPAELSRLAGEIADRTISATGLQVLSVLGHYPAGLVADPGMREPYLHGARAAGLAPDWAVCVFGPQETARLRYARMLGGKVRVGFENSLFIANGSIAPDNGARVRERATLAAGLGQGGGRAVNQG